MSRREVDGTVTAEAVESSASPSPHGVGQDDPTRTRQQGLDDTVSASTPAHSPGDRLSAPLRRRDPDRYDKLAEHGRGGLGRVFRARDRELGRDVALKELIKRSVSAEQRFLREALITARLEHPGIVPIHEAGRWPDGTPFYAMKLVAGRSLKELIADRKESEERLALLPNVAAVADAIAYAHDRRIIHRDLKPGNVIIGDFGETIVIDWGLAKVLGEADDPSSSGDGPSSSDEELTMAGSVLGTPAYMAPEQARGEPADRRADVYAIGMILYHLCTGARNGDPRDMDRSLAAGIDPDLLAIIARATEAEPARRHPDARALAQDLHAFLGGRRVRSRTYNLAELVAHWVRHNKRLLLAGVVLVTFIAVVVGWSLREASVERERARATHVREQQAHAAARSQRDQALLARATALVGSDPTAALALLRDLAPSAEAALVEARSLGAGVAAYASPVFTRRLVAAVPAPDLSKVAFVTEARSLAIIDVGSGTITELARDVDISGRLAWADGTWRFTPPAPNGDVHRSLPSGRAVAGAATAANGDIALVDTDGNAYAVTTRDVELVGMHATSVAAEGTWLAWGFRDGRATIRDGNGHTGWTFQAHAGAVRTLALEPATAKVLTGSEDTLRVWSLARRPPPPKVRAPCAADQLVRHPARANLVAARCANSTALVIDLDGATSRVVEGARAISSPIVWHGERLCWGARDGALRCGEPSSTSTETIAEQDSPIRALASDGARLFFVTADGEIFRHTGRTSSAPHGRVDSEPTGLRVATPEELVVTARSGKVVFIGLDGKSETLTGHQDVPVHVVTSEPGDVFVASWDGSVSRWRDRTFRARHTASGPVRDVRAVSDGFAAVVGATGLWVETTELSLALSLPGVARALATNRTYVAFGTESGEVIVVDIVGRRIASIPLGHEIGAITSLDDGRFAVATAHGAIHIVETDAVAFVDLPAAP